MSKHCDRCGKTEKDDIEMLHYGKLLCKQCEKDMIKYCNSNCSKGTIADFYAWFYSQEAIKVLLT